MELIRSSMSMSEVWNWLSQKIESGEVDFGVPEIDDRRWILGEWDNQWYLLYDDNEVMWSYTLLRLLTTEFMVRKLQLSAAMQIRCSGGMAPPSTIPSTIQRCRIQQTHARVTMEWDLDSASTIPTCTDATAKINLRINTESSLMTNVYGTVRRHMRLVDGRATTFKKEGNDRTGIKNNSTTNNQHPGSARTKHRELHCPIETASSSQRTRGTIVKLDSGHGDDLSAIWWIHKAGHSAVSTQRQAFHEMYREAHLKHSRQAYLTNKWQAH